MPAINVARTDTFEVQRQKINQIGDILSNISAGGSDLQTGNLKLGDGTISSPSLSFISDDTLGIYKPTNNSIGYTSSGKRIFDITQSGLFSYKDFYIQRNYLVSSDVSATNNGSGYEPGTYSNLTLIGGSGEQATISITVESFLGSITNSGQNYIPGTFTSVSMVGGLGAEATATVTVSSISGSILSPGQNYGEIDVETGARTAFYSSVPLTNGSGSGATADLLLNPDTGAVDIIIFVDSGQNYVDGDILSVDNADLGGVGSGFQVEVTRTPGVVESIQFTSKGSGYAVGDTLTLPSPVTNISTTLDDTSSTITVSSSTGILSGYIVEKVSGVGELAENTTVISVSGNDIDIFPQPTLSGSIVVNFVPPFGSGTTNFEYEISDIGTVGSFSILEGGNGYNIGDTFTVSAQDLIQPTEIDVTVKSVQELTFAGSVAAGTFSPGDLVKQLDGNILTVFLTTSSTVLSGALNTYTNVSAVSSTGSGYGATFDVIRDAAGDVSGVLLNQTGFLYSSGDILTISGSLVGGSSPSDDITLEVTGVNEGVEYPVFSVEESVGVTNSITTEFFNVNTGDFILKSGSSTTYEISTTSGSENRFFLDLGSGEEISPNLNFYSGETYKFNLTDQSTSGHPFAFSIFRDGLWSPSLVENVSTTLSSISKQITITSTTNILAGMEVTVSSGDGRLPQDCLVESVDDATTLTLTEFPTLSGDAVLQFNGIEYTNGVVRESEYVLLKVTDDTPNLYYYCQNHPNMGGRDNKESLITINLNNPRVFGSGFSLIANSISQIDLIEGDSDTGLLKAQNIESNSLTASLVSANTSVESPSVDTDVVYTEQLSTQSTLEIFSDKTNFNSDISLGTKFTVSNSTGNVTALGVIKSLNSLNVNDKLLISENVISSTSGNDVIVTPPTGRVLKVNNESALVIPSGTTDQRPSPGIVEDGSIRFNTQTNQYEGYSETTSSWSSLGGVRDLDGNTTITAEETVGSNDNTLWFINDNVNTVRFTTQYQEFVNVKKIRSVNVSAPDYENWSANDPVNAGDYLKYRNNIYEVIISGTTATSGNEPTDTTGDPFINGTATLQYSTTAVAPLTFDEISEVRIDPLGFTDLVVNDELRFSTNTISSTNNDIIIEPIGSQKLEIKSTSSLVLPVGDTNSRGNPKRGSVRYNTTDAQFEGYNGSQWGGLGGVKDVDQDTKIEAETGPGNDEDILYFFNAGDNTLRLTTTQLEFGSIDTIVSSSTDNFNINASVVTFDSLATTIDNSSSTISFITTTKDNLDFGISTGVNNDHLLRLKDTGEVVFNLGFGTGTPDNLTLLNADLTNFGLKHTRVSTSRIPLVRGTLNSGNSTIYSTATESSAKIFLTAHNTTTGDKEIVEYYVIDNGTDVYFTDTNNIKTGAELISSVFDIDPSNNVRISFTLNTGVTVGDNVTVTLIKTVTKR